MKRPVVLSVRTSMLALAGIPVLTAMASPPSLPLAFRNYRRVLAVAGPWLAARARVPVYLPRNACEGIGPTHCGPLAVGVSTQAGYQIAFAGKSAEIRSPEDVLAMDAGADFVGTVWGVPAGSDWIRRIRPKHQYLPLHWTFGAATVRPLQLATGVTAHVLTARGMEQIGWYQRGWHYMIRGTEAMAVLRATANALARSSASRSLPATTGIAIVGLYSDTPSEVTYVRGGTRYFIYAMGNRALGWAEHLVAVRKI